MHCFYGLHSLSKLKLPRHTRWNYMWILTNWLLEYMMHFYPFCCTVVLQDFFHVETIWEDIKSSTKKVKYVNLRFSEALDLNTFLQLTNNKQLEIKTNTSTNASSFFKHNFTFKHFNKYSCVTFLCSSILSSPKRVLHQPK